MTISIQRRRSALPAAIARLAVACAILTPTASAAIEPAELIEIAKTAYPGDLCWWERVEEATDEFKSHVIKFRYDHEGADDPERQVTVHEMPCTYGAYNFGTLWFIEKEYEGLIPLHFAEPDVVVSYKDDESTELESMHIAGFTATPNVVNSFFDEETKSITGFSKWRGLGDAASSGEWTFRNGDFVLTHYSVDPTYNGEIDPIVVYDAAAQK